MNPSLNESSVITALQDHLKRKLSTETRYVVDRIVAHRPAQSATQYRILWYIYTPNDDTL